MFLCGAEEGVLDAADRSRIGLPNGCRKGDCGACAAELVEGNATSSALANRLPLCLARPLSNLKIRVRELPWQPLVTTQRLPIRIVDKTVCGRVCVLKIRYPKSATFDFRPGQYVGIEATDGRQRYFSIASGDATDRELEFHIGHVPGGLLTTDLHQSRNIGDMLWMEGPFGDFHVPCAERMNAVLIAGGTGFAPLKACLLAIAGSDRAAGSIFHLYWGMRSHEEFYDLAGVHRLLQALPELKITLVSETAGSSMTSIRVGRVHRAAMQDFPDMSSINVFACGSPAMMDAIAHDFSQSCDMKPERFFSDAFNVAGGTERRLAS